MTGGASPAGRAREGRGDNRKAQGVLGPGREGKEDDRQGSKFHSDFTKSWTTPGQRIIGEIVHVKYITVAIKPHYFTRDWALSELYNDKFNWATFKGNKVYAGGNVSSSDYGKIVFPQPEDRAGFKYPQDGLLQAFSVVQAHEIYNPQPLDPNEEKCLPVVTNDLATGTTIRRVMGMEPFTRVYKEYDI